jgi:nitrate reductase gamma subunit
VQHDPRLAVFWIVHPVLLGLFGVELLFVLSVWLKARLPGLPANASRWRKLGVVIGFVIGLIFSRRIWAMLQALVTDGMAHRRLYRVSPRRWAIHISVFGSWLALGALSTVTGVVVEILPLLGMSPQSVALLPVVGQLYHADVWWVAAVNEILGLIVLAGMILVIYRRYVQKDQQLRTIPADGMVIGLLFLIALSGFPTETFRLLADYTTAAGIFSPSPAMLSPDKFPPALIHVWGPQWGFVSYLAALVLGALKLAPAVWETFHSAFFWLHFAIVTLLLYYLPFSRFFHVIMSPMIVAYNTVLDRERQHGHKQSGQPRPRPIA